MPNPRRQSRRHRRGHGLSIVPIAGQLDSWAEFADRRQPRAMTQDRPPIGSRRAPSPGILPPPL
uniref:Uncharacterized protein n=1 Tax=Arundo donax TaxID=35708 RepID=A0A0A8Z834_ARUDO